MEHTTVYQYFAANGALIYVGITNRGTRRLHEHAESKPWWHLATGCTLEHFTSRDEALRREAELISRYRPPYNTQHNPERNRPLAERAQERLRVAPRHLDQRPRVVKQRRAAWYELPRERRLVEPCVICGERPGVTAPTCLPCTQKNFGAPVPSTPTPPKTPERVATSTPERT